MRTSVKVGILGMTYFTIGALMLGKSLDVLTSSENVGMVVMISGVYICGYFLAMKKE